MPSKPQSRLMKHEAVKRGDCCRYCNVRLNLRNITLDHMIPLSLGGNDHPGNICFACERCNNLKGDATAIEFRKPPEEKPPKTKREKILIPEYRTLDEQAAKLGLTTSHLIAMIIKRAAKIIRRRNGGNHAR